MSSWDQMNGHLTQNAGSYLLLALALTLLAIAFAGFLWFKFRVATRPFSQVQVEEGETSEILKAVLQTAARTEASIAELESRLLAHLQESRLFIKQIGLVRYDAFENVAGKQSFSLCLLNKDKNGVLITYLASKGATRSYAVTIDQGSPSRELSDEEKRALDGAFSTEPLVPA